MSKDNSYWVLKDVKGLYLAKSSETQLKLGTPNYVKDLKDAYHFESEFLANSYALMFAHTLFVLKINKVCN